MGDLHSNNFGMNNKTFYKPYIPINNGFENSEMNQEEPPGKFGIGNFYKYGVFSGNSSEIFSNYRAYKLLYLDLRYNKLFFDLGWSLIGTMGRINQATLVDKVYDGEFYGKYREFYFSCGYSVFSNSKVSIVPTIGLSRLFHEVYTLKTQLFVSLQNVQSSISESIIIGIGPGVFMDFELVRFGYFKELDLSVRTRYNAYIIAKEELYSKKGIMHEFSIGVIFSIGFD
jgi:hypothetical protein